MPPTGVKLLFNGLAKAQPNYSVKWTAAMGRGIFVRFVAAATYLKR